MTVKPPDIPAPRPDDAEYMKLWHRALQSDIDNYGIQRNRDAWRAAFCAVAAILFATVITLTVLVGSKFIRTDFI